MTSEWEMNAGIVYPVKQEHHCAVPGCWKEATFFPHKNRNVRFCDQHALGLIRKTIQQIILEENYQ